MYSAWILLACIFCFLAGEDFGNFNAMTDCDRAGVFSYKDKVYDCSERTK